MSSVWEFVKRHRGKIATVGIAIGGAYVVKKAIENDAFQSLMHSQTVTIEPQSGFNQVCLRFELKTFLSKYAVWSRMFV